MDLAKAATLLEVRFMWMHERALKSHEWPFETHFFYFRTVIFIWVKHMDTNFHLRVKKINKKVTATLFLVICDFISHKVSLAWFCDFISHNMSSYTVIVIVIAALYHKMGLLHIIVTIFNNLTLYLTTDILFIIIATLYRTLWLYLTIWLFCIIVTLYLNYIFSIS